MQTLTMHETPFSKSMASPIPKHQILDSSKLKEFVDDSFKLDEDGRKFSNWVKNTEGKREIAPYEQFLIFSVFL